MTLEDHIREAWEKSTACDNRIKTVRKKTRAARRAARKNAPAPVAAVPRDGKPSPAVPRSRGRFVMAMASEYFDVTVEQIVGINRARNAVAARHVVMWVLRELGWSLNAIGKLLGRDHTTVLYGARKLEVDACATRQVADDILARVRKVPSPRYLAAECPQWFHLISGHAYSAADRIKPDISHHLLRRAIAVLLHIHGFTSDDIAHFMAVDASKIEQEIRRFHTAPDENARRIVAAVTATLEAING